MICRREDGGSLVVSWGGWRRGGQGGIERKIPSIERQRNPEYRGGEKSLLKAEDETKRFRSIASTKSSTRQNKSVKSSFMIL